jgi:hypothetical protein
MVERAALVVPLIGVIITAILGGSTISSIYSAIYQPNIDVQLVPDRKDIHNVTIRMINTGQASAKDVILTVEAPSRINTYNIFSTENYSNIHVNSSTCHDFPMERAQRYVYIHH